MQPFRSSLCQVSKRFPASSPLKLRLSATTPSILIRQTRTMTSEKGELNIENKNLHQGAGVNLDDHQKTLVGCVLDLFAGRPSLAKLQLWNEDATFEDPIAVAKGRTEYEPQWYGLQQAFSAIERLSHEVTSSGNPITMNMKTKYTVKGVEKDQTIDSVVNIFVGSNGKIEKVQDKWNGQLPEGSIKDVSSIFTLLSPFWWLRYAGSWGFWAWSFVWYTWPWRAFRRANAVTMPKVVSVPKDAEEDRARGN